ncbi:MAG: LysE family translocator [Gammaproteobacteria bacterium]|nr:LysE family translocator [Gammaproteobacteria bacterium]NIR94027.1 LysE family translocator [Gammaproteobacteria bacterium]
MDFWQGITIVTLVHILAALSPGPDLALMTRQSLVHGRYAGIWTSVGISLGLSIHILYSVAGLAAVIVHSAQWMIFFKIAGGCYLLFLGISGLRSQPEQPGSPSLPREPVRNSPYRFLVSGLLCNALNPKAAVYFLSLFTVVLSPDMPVLTLALFGAWIMLLQFICFTSLACVFTHKVIHDKFVKAGHWIDRVFGVAMVALGLRVLTSDVN